MMIGIETVGGQGTISAYIAMICILVLVAAAFDDDIASTVLLAVTLQTKMSSLVPLLLLQVTWLSLKESALGSKVFEGVSKHIVGYVLIRPCLNI